MFTKFNILRALEYFHQDKKPCEFVLNSIQTTFCVNIAKLSECLRKVGMGKRLRVEAN